MTVLKWLIIVAALGYLGGLVVLFFAQRSLIFPIPQTARTAPEAAGFPEAEEHVLTTDDGEKVIVWHVRAKPGHAVVLYFHGNGDFLAGRASTELGSVVPSYKPGVTPTDLSQCLPDFAENFCYLSCLILSRCLVPQSASACITSLNVPA